MTRSLQCPPAGGLVLVVAIAAMSAAAASAGERLFVTLEQALERYELPDVVNRTRLSPPRSIFADHFSTCSPQGVLHFPDNATASVLRWTQDGVELPALSLPDSHAQARGVTVDADGNVYINAANPRLCCGYGVWRIAGGDPANVPEQILAPVARETGGAAIVAGGPHAGALVFAAGTPARVYISEPPGDAPREFIGVDAFPAQSFARRLEIHSDPCGQLYTRSVGNPSGGLIPLDRYDPEGVLLERVMVPVGFENHAPDSEGNFYATFDDELWMVTNDRTLRLLDQDRRFFDTVTVCRDPLECTAGGPYVAECSGPRTCLSLQAEPTPPCATYSWTSDCPGADFGGTENQAGATLCLDSSSCPTRCRVSLAMTEGIFRKAACEAEVAVVDTRPPALRDIPTNETAACDRVPLPAPVRAEDECDAGPALLFAETRNSGRCPGDYSLLRTWLATDECGNQDRAEQRIEVRDLTPPTVVAGHADLHCLWPPDHRYECFELADFSPAIADDCSEPIFWRFAGCASDQADDAPDLAFPGWNGDGNTRDDCRVESGGERICVRAERAGAGPTAAAGRRYAVSIVAMDACGNETTPVGLGTLHVPHDRRAGDGRCR